MTTAEDTRCMASGGARDAARPLRDGCFARARVARALGVRGDIAALRSCASRRRATGIPLLVVSRPDASDVSTRPLRRFPGDRSNDPKRLELGRNLGPRAGVSSVPRAAYA